MRKYYLHITDLHITDADNFLL